MKKYFIYILAAMAFASCDYLDLEPLDKPSSETFLRSEQELLMASNGCYNALWFNVNGEVPLYIMLDALSDIGTNRLNGETVQLIPNGSVATDNAWMLSLWKNHYGGISSCNYLLENMNRAEAVTSPELYKRIEAEARFLRAFYYAYLSELWGDVPLLTTNISISEAQMPNTSKATITQFILDELAQAAEALPWTYAQSDAGRATKGAALALRSRIALYNEKWDEAISSAKKVIDEGPHSLHNHYGNLFLYAGQDSKEIIFAIQYLKGEKVHAIPFRLGNRLMGGTSERFPLLALVDSYECTDGKSIDKSDLYDPMHPELNRDPRLGYTLIMPNTIYWGYQYETHADSTQCWNYNTTPATRVDNGEVTNSYATTSGFNWKKYIDVVDKPDMRNADLNFTLIRYAEVLLNYAEAKIEKNEIDESVYKAINEIRQRESVGMPPIASGKTQAEMRSVIRKERKYELAGEGLRLFDIRRWKLAETVMNGKIYGRPKIKGTSCWMNEPPAIDEWGTPDYENISNKNELRTLDTRVFDKNKHYLWPIPKLELDTNSELKQNPNW